MLDLKHLSVEGLLDVAGYAICQLRRDFQPYDHLLRVSHLRVELVLLQFHVIVLKIELTVY